MYLQKTPFIKTGFSAIILFAVLFSFSACSGNKDKGTDSKENKTGLSEHYLNRLKSANGKDSLLVLMRKFSGDIEEKTDTAEKAHYYAGLGVLLYQHSELHLSDSVFGMARVLYGKMNDSANAMHMWMNQAAMKEMSGNYDSAVAIYLKVIGFFKRKKDTVQLANGYNNLAILYEEIEQPDKAITYNTKALALRKKIKDTLNIAYSYNNLGVVYTELKKNTDSALYFYKKAATIFKMMHATMPFATVTNNIGHIYLDRKEYNSAEQYFRYPLHVYDSLDMDQGKAEVLRSFGQLYFAKGEYDRAVKSLQQATELNKKLLMMKEVLEIQKILTKIYISTGDYAKATELMQDHNRVSDSLMGLEKQKTIADMETKYRVTEKNKTIEVLRLKDALNKKQIKYQTLFIAFLVSVFVLIVVLFYFNRKKNEEKQRRLRLELQNYLLRIGELQNEINDKGDCTKFPEEKLKQFDLSEREAEVLRMIALGYKNSDIAKKLFISANTVKTHIKNIYVKLDVKNRVGALQRLDMVR